VTLFFNRKREEKGNTFSKQPSYEHRIASTGGKVYVLAHNGDVNEVILILDRGDMSDEPA